MEPNVTTDPTSILFLNQERLTRLPPASIRLGFLDISNALVNHRRVVRSAEWALVLETSASLLGLGYAYLGILRRHASTSTHSNQAFLNVGETFRKAFAAIAKNDERERVVSETRERLSQDDPELLSRIEDILQQIELGKTRFPRINDRISNVRSAKADAAVRSAASLAVAALSRGLQGLMHYYFNVSFSSFDPASSIDNLDRVQRTFSQILEKNQSTLLSAQRQLYASVVNDVDTNVVIESAYSLVRLVEDIMPSFAAAQARFLRIVHGLRDAGKGGASEKAGALLASAGFLSREAIASHAAANALTLEVGATRSSRAEQLLTRANDVAFDTDIPNGKNTKLSKLDATDDGTFVEVSGFAQLFQQGRSPDGKLISRVEILDPSSGATASASAVFVHLPHAGVTEGAFLNMSGVYRSSSDLLDGEAGIEIDVLSLADLAARSWRIQLLRYAEPWIEVWRNQLNLYWSIGPHAFAEDDSEEANRGAAELVFAPFAREF